MRPVTRLGKDRVRLELSSEELDLLRGLPGELRELLESDDQRVHGRLFPPAYTHDEDRARQEEYRSLMHDELLRSKLAAIEVVTSALERATASRGRQTVILDDEEATAWLAVLNDLRLVLGVRAGITTEEDWEVPRRHPRSPAIALLHYLGWLEEELIQALS